MSTIVDLEKHFPCDFCDETFSTSDDKGKHLDICASKTDLCPDCEEYVPRMFFAYHKANNCTNPDVSDSRNPIESTTGKLIREKTSKVYGALGEVYYEPELNHVKKEFEFNIIVMGSPRVGKSSLINAICGQTLAETSPSLHPCTKDIKCYLLENNQRTNLNVQSLRINIWDTPGIESWNENNGTETMKQFIQQIDPICVIYCASPGSVAKLDQLKETFDFCKEKKIFCALVCTNMWSGCQRKQIIQEFESQLKDFGPREEKLSQQPNGRSAHKIILFGRNALCTMVNSVEYIDEDFSDKVMPVQGIDELIHSIMESLNDEKLLGWCYTVLNRRTYWEKLTQNIGGFFQLHMGYPYALIVSSYEQTAINFARFFQEKLSRT